MRDGKDPILHGIHFCCWFNGWVETHPYQICVTLSTSSFEDAGDGGGLALPLFGFFAQGFMAEGG